MSVYKTLVDIKLFEVNITVVANVSFSDSVDGYIDCSDSVFWTLVDGVVIEVSITVDIEVANVSFTDSVDWCVD